MEGEYDEVSTGTGELGGGEGGEGGDISDGLFNDVTIEGLDFLEGKEGDGKPAKKKGEEGATGKETPEKKDDGLDGIDVKALNAKLAELEQDKRNLKKALHEERQSKKRPAAPDGGDSAESVLTDSQLLKIMEEYQGDNATILNVIKYQAEQAAKRHGQKAVENMEIIARKKEADAFLAGMYPALSEEGSELRLAVDQTKERFGIEDHPLGDLFAAGVGVLTHLEQIKKAAFEEGKKKALEESAETGRKQRIAGNSVIVKGKGAEQGGAAGLTAGQLETAKKLGFKPGTPQYEHFKRIVGSGKPADRVFVEG